MTLDEIRKTKVGRLPINLHLNDVVGAVATKVPKLSAIQALDGGLQKPARGTGSVAIRCVIIALRRKILDGHDNCAYACKPLTDAIAESLQLDDADKRITWEYHQVKTFGDQGAIVRIEVSHE